MGVATNDMGVVYPSVSGGYGFTFWYGRAFAFPSLVRRQCPRLQLVVMEAKPKPPAVCGVCGHSLKLHGDLNLGCRHAEIEPQRFGRARVLICGCTVLQKRQEKVA